MFWPLIGRFKKIGAPLIEGAYQISERLRLFILALSGQKTVKEVVKPESLRTGKVVIFASYPAEGLSHHHVRLLNKFKALGFSILFVTNHPKPRAALNTLLSEDWCFIFRRPFGRDFGCYKDAATLLYSWSQQTKTAIERVILLNDSVLTFEPFEDRVLSHLTNQTYGFAGITENYEFCHHIGSFMVGMSGEAFESSALKKFWKNYKPISTRRHSIHKGEFGLTRALKKAGFVPRVLYTVADMKEYLERADVGQLEKIHGSMQPIFKREFGSALQKIDQNVYEFIGDDSKELKTRKIGEKFGRGLATLLPSTLIHRRSEELLGTSSTEDFDLRMLRIVRYRERLLGMSESLQKQILAHRTREQIINDVVRFVFRGSQIHHGAALLLFMGAGILKKDVVFRQIVEPFDLPKLLEEAVVGLSKSEQKEIVAEILSKGHPYSLRGKDKILYNWGFI